MKLELTVVQVTRGKIRDINTHKARIEASHDSSGATLVYWTSVDIAPPVGVALLVTVEEAP